MAGHALLMNVTKQELWDMQQYIKGTKISPLMHANIAWNDISKGALKDAVSVGIANRDSLPPHFYIQFPMFRSPQTGEIDENEVTFLRSLDKTAWFERIIKPNNMGLKASPGANIGAIKKNPLNGEEGRTTEQAIIDRFYSEGRNMAAFLRARQYTNEYSLEVYYLDGVPINAESLANRNQP